MNSATNNIAQWHPTVSANVLLLHQGLDLLKDTSDLEYTRTVSEAFDSGIGAHVRHIIDHYTCFFDGLVQGYIDYSARKRDSLLANDRAAAAKVLCDLIERLCRLDEVLSEQKVKVVDECSGAPGSDYLYSTAKRELQFLVNHTAHHYALIAIILRLAGREPVPGFGLSASTIRHAEALQSKQSRTNQITT